MGAGYSGKPLIDKLGFKPGMRVLLLNPPADYKLLLGADTAEINFLTTPPRNQVDVVHGFFIRRKVMEHALKQLEAQLNPDGMFWVSWPKKASGVSTDLTEDVLREVILPTGLVDIKVCAVDDTWSALKFVRRKEQR